MELPPGFQAYLIIIIYILFGYVFESSFFTASLVHFSCCVYWGAAPLQFLPVASYIFRFAQKTASYVSGSYV